MIRRLRTLRWRLTVTYIAMLALVLAGLGLYQYVTLRQTLIASRVDVFDGDVALAKSLFARTAPRTLAPDAAARRFAALITTVSGRTVAVIVYGADGSPMATAPSGTAVPSLTSQDLAAGGATEVTAPSGERFLAAVYHEVLPSGGVRVVVLTSMAPMDTVLGRQTGLLVVGGAVALLAALALGLGLTSRGLRPLLRLTDTARALAHGDLGARSRLAHGDDEIGRLGQAFDEMAASLESAFAARAQSETRVRRFIADASHELRTPVTSLKGYIDVMRRGAGRDPEALDAILESMQREAERMRLLVLDLLTLARIDAEKPPANGTVDVNAVVSRVIDEGVPGMPAEVVRDLAPGAVLARGDEEAVVTVARNLLVNACKYAPAAAQRWSTRVDGARVVVTVHDDGPGIPAADLPHVFERFYRGEKTRAREEGGSGLGLSIVHGLVQSMGGEVRIDSAEGSGTTVTFVLPRAS